MTDITAPRQETKLTALRCVALPSPSTRCAAAWPGTLDHHQPQRSPPLDAPSIHQIRSRSNPPSPVSRAASSPPICCSSTLGSETVGHQRPRHLISLLALASGLPLHCSQHKHPAPATSASNQQPLPPCAARRATTKNVRTSHRVVDNDSNPTSANTHRITLRPELKADSNNLPPPVVTCVCQREQRLFGTPSQPARAPPSFLGCSIPLCCYRSASSAASNLAFALCSGSRTRTTSSTSSPFCCALALCHSLKPPTSA